MTGGNALSTSQPGQRALRLVPPPQEATPASTGEQAPSATPALRRLQKDLEAARAEARCLHELLEELPAILERKFQLRFHALLAEQGRLEHDNALLKHHLLALLSGDEASLLPPTRALPPAAMELSPREAAESEPSSITQGLGLRRALRLRHL